MDNRAFIYGFIIGLIAGAIGALLNAPASSTTTRQQLLNRALDAKEQVEDKLLANVNYPNF